nr:hypothetical protein [Flavimaricola sp.]
MLLATAVSATGEVRHTPDTKTPEHRLKPFDLPMLPDEAAEDTGTQGHARDHLQERAVVPDRPIGSDIPLAPS